MTTIGQAVQRTRQQLGLSTTTLAHQADVDDSDLIELESGKRSVGASVLLRLARAMGLPPTAFLTDDAARVANPALNRAKFFHATNAPMLSEADIVALAREITRARMFAELARPRVTLDDFEPSKPGGRPWRQGYDLAATLRSKLGLLATPIVSMAGLLEDDLGILVARHAFADSRLRAAAIRAPDARLVAVSRRLSIALLRVSLAHELCHHLCDLQPNEALGEADDVSIEGFSGAESGEEQRAKAFAVMLLAPSALVREMFGPPDRQFATASKAIDAARALAARCGLGTTAALWHLFHLHYLVDQETDVQLWQRGAGKETSLDGFEPSYGDQDGLLRAIDRALASDEIDPDQAERLRHL